MIVQTRDGFTSNMFYRGVAVYFFKGHGPSAPWSASFHYLEEPYYVRGGRITVLKEIEQKARAMVRELIKEAKCNLAKSTTKPKEAISSPLTSLGSPSQN